MKIADASAILALLLDEQERAKVKGLLANERLIAPHLLLLEVANKCAVEARRFPDKKHDYIDVLAKFLDLTSNSMTSISLALSSWPTFTTSAPMTPAISGWPAIWTWNS
ncbi:MAG TPA: hypothetical protein VGF56_13170 [Rhizomicrobium sp.]